MTPLILISSHSAHIPLVEALQAEAFARLMIIGGAEFDGYLQAAQSRLQAHLQRAHTDCARSAEALAHAEFQVSGINVTSEVSSAISEVVVRNLSLFHVLEAVFEDLQRETPIGLIIVHNDVTPLMRMLIAIAERNEIPTLHLPHGIELSRMALENFDDVVRTSMVATVGEHCQDWFLGNSHFLNSPDKIVPVGRPEWDGFYQKPLVSLVEARLQLGIELSCKVVGFAGSWAHDLTTFDMGPELEKRFRSFLRGIRQLDVPVQVLVRLHPGSVYAGNYGEEWHQRIAQEEGVDLLFCNSSQEQFLAASDLIVSLDSTFGTVALLADRVSMSIAWQHPGILTGSGYEGLPGIAACSGDEEAIIVTLHRCLLDEEYRRQLSAARDETLRRLNHGHDGRATERVIHLIRTMMKGASKPMASTYYQHARPEVLALIPETARHVLDVGCASGALGRAVKQRQECRVTGIEYVAEVAQVAAESLDDVYAGDAVEAMQGMPDAFFDCIVFADVLEHLVDPAACLAEAKRLLTPGGMVVASIPNVRHWSVVKDLLEGRWDYQDAGILDRTHLRFFTRESMVRMFMEAGFHVNTLSGTVLQGFGVPVGLADNLAKAGVDTSTLNQEGRVYQYLLTASPIAPIKNPGLTSIVLLGYNQLAFTKLCVESVLEYTDSPFELILVDNGSTDGTGAYFQELAAQDSRVRPVLNSKNRGFAAGCNQGVVLAKGEYVLFLNNDTVVSPGWLGRMIAHFDRQADVGAVGAVSNCVSGPQQLNTIPFANHPSSLPLIKQFAQDLATREDGRGFDLPRLVGFCLMVHRSVLDRIGGFDPQFGIGNFEDDDLCLRIRTAGYRTWVAQDVYVHHFGSRTFAALGPLAYDDAMDAGWERFKSRWNLPAHLDRTQPFRVTLPTFNARDHFVPLPAIDDPEFFDSGEAFRPGVSPMAIPDRRQLAFFHHPNWSGIAWQDVVAAYLRAFEPTDEVSLVLWLDPVQGVSLEDASQLLLDSMERMGIDPDQAPDLLLVPDVLDLAGLARLYAGTHCVVPAGDAIQETRASKLGLPTLTDLSEKGWRDVLRGHLERIALEA